MPVYQRSYRPFLLIRRRVLYFKHFSTFNSYQKFKLKTLNFKPIRSISSVQPNTKIVVNSHSSAWPSGLRRATQVRMERSAQVRTLPLTFFILLMIICGQNHKKMRCLLKCVSKFVLGTSRKSRPRSGRNSHPARQRVSQDQGWQTRSCAGNPGAQISCTFTFLFFMSTICFKDVHFVKLFCSVDWTRDWRCGTGIYSWKIKKNACARDAERAS